MSMYFGVRNHLCLPPAYPCLQLPCPCCATFLVPGFWYLYGSQTKETPAQPCPPPSPPFFVQVDGTVQPRIKLPGYHSAIHLRPSPWWRPRKNIPKKKELSSYADLQHRIDSMPSRPSGAGSQVPISPPAPWVRHIRTCNVFNPHWLVSE